MSALPAFVRRLLVPALALWGVVAAASAYGPLLFSPGLIATYYEGREWRGVPRFTGQEFVGGGDWLAAGGHRLAGETFSVSWRGWLAVESPATFDIAALSNGLVWVFVDDTRVVDGYAPAQAGLRQGQIALARGVHRIQVDLAAGSELSVQWARAGNPLHDLGVTVLYPTRLAYYLSTQARPGLLVSGAAGLGLLLLGAAGGAGRLGRHLDATAATPAERAWLGGILALAAALQLWQLWWGLPQHWELDEVLAGPVILGARQGFADGWHALYPPLFFAALSVLSWPFMAAATLGVLDLWSEPSLVAQLLLYRLAMVLCGLAVVVLAYRCGMEAFADRRAALWAAFLCATLPLLVYLTKFSKADVPYTAAFLAAMLEYLRALGAPSAAVYGRFAFWGMVAICLKDQAYGLIVLPALHLVWLRWRAHAASGPVARVVATATDGALARAALVAVGVFVAGHNLPFNADGFVQHVQLITGGGSVGFRTYPRTIAGQVEMLVDGLWQVPWLFGWPAALVIAGSLVVAWRVRREAAVAVVLPVVSYYLTFMAVIQYQYDRFYLAPAVLLAIIGGLGLARLAAAPALVARAAVAVIVVQSVAYGASIDLLMARDSRFAAEAWLRQHLDHGELVGLAGPRPYLPRPGPLPATDVNLDWTEVTAAPPEYLVVNAEYARRPRNFPFFEPLLAGTQPLYREAAIFKSTPGPAVLAYRPEFANGVEDPFTNFDKINPEIRVFVRRDVTIDD